MSIIKFIRYFLILSILFIISSVVVLQLDLFSESVGPGEITGSINSTDFIEDKINRQQLAMEQLEAPKAKQILFGDLHVHSTYSADAHQWSLPIVGGTGLHPVADACDFARHCSALDFWAITDHAEASTPKRWQETKETIRKCNSLNTDKSNPDCVAFIGWEWTQVGINRNIHWGHHNVILAEEDDELLPERAIASASVTRQALFLNPVWPNVLYPFVDIKNFKRYNDYGKYVEESARLPICEKGIPSKDLPLNCHEETFDPLELVNKVEEYESDYMIIPHGQSWGFYTPMAYSLDKGLELSKQYPKQFELLEIYSGHGNSEEYRSYRGVDVVRQGGDLPLNFWTYRNGNADLEKGTLEVTEDGETKIYDLGTQTCPEPSENFVAPCWRAGEVIYKRCIDEGIDESECKMREEVTREASANRQRDGFKVVPNYSEAEKGTSGQCTDCYSPPLNHVPTGSAQYGLALTKFNEDGSKHRFRYGFIASSDNHEAAPGSGYKEIFGNNIDGVGPPNKFYDKLLHSKDYVLGEDNYDVRDDYVSDSEPVLYDPADVRLGFDTIEFERQRGFFTTGGLAAVHSEGRSKQEIWEAMKRRETYATSGPRILLWFNLVNSGLNLPMGSVVEMHDVPKFEVKAMGSFKQKPGCPEDAFTALGEERVEELCYDECYNPSDERKKITRIEVIRVMPQEYEDQPVDDRIQDSWKVHDCDTSEIGCSFTFQDNEFLTAKQDVSYYVRAIEEPSPTINVKGGVCKREENGECVEFKLCTQDWKHPRDVESCSEEGEHRAWSSPIYVDYLL